jgi:hypothetical protein
VDRRRLVDAGEIGRPPGLGDEARNDAHGAAAEMPDIVAEARELDDARGRGWR